MQRFIHNESDNSIFRCSSAFLILDKRGELRGPVGLTILIQTLLLFDVKDGSMSEVIFGQVDLAGPL